MPSRRSGNTGAIDWRDATFGGACLGGVLWATIAYPAMTTSGSGPSAVTKWTVVAAVCIGLTAVGLAVARWALRGGLRTAGIAAVIASMTGPVAILGFFGLGAIVG